MNYGKRTLDFLLRPIGEYLNAPGVNEIVVNTPGRFGIEQRGQWHWIDCEALTYDWLDAIGIVAAGSMSKLFDPAHPVCSTFLPGGQRITLIQPPATTSDTISATIRIPSKNEPTIEGDDFKILMAASETYRDQHDPVDDMLLEYYYAKNWTEFFKLAVISKKTIGVTGTNRSGKAQPLDAKVLTPTGWRQMGDLKPGDLVTCPDGHIAPITGVFPQGEKEVFQVTFYDDRTVECCDDHLWKIWTWTSEFETGKSHATRKRLPSGKWTIVPLSKMRKGGSFMRCAGVPLVEPLCIEFPPQSLPIPPYTLGVLLGDGCLHNKMGSITLSNPEKHILDRLLTDMPDYEAAYVPTSACDYRLTMKVQRKVSPLRLALTDMGLMGVVSHTKFIPDCYKRGSAAQRLELLQGLLDTDGSVEKSTRLSITTTSERMAKDIQEIAWSLGAIAPIASRQTFFTYKGVKKAGRLSWRVSIIYPDISLLVSSPKHLNKCVKKEKTHRLNIKSIKSIGTKPVQCISIGHPNGLYVTDNYVVTHNTTFLKRLMRAILAHERLVTIEDTPEFGELPLENRVSLFFGSEGVTAELLIETTLRMAASRVAMQELRGAEAYAFLRLQAAGQPGSLTTWHADVDRPFDPLKMMIKQHDAGKHIPDDVLDRILRGFIDIVVYCKREEFAAGPPVFSVPSVYFRHAKEKTL